MRRVLHILFSLALVCYFPQVATAKGKSDKKTVFQPHAQGNQDTMDATGKHSDKDFVVREWDGSLYIEASLIYWEGDDRTVSLVLAIQNPAAGGPPATPKPQQLFVPSTIIVLLPNGHSYRPYNRADVLQQAYAMENAQA
jgi:hypothetical protein